MKPFDLELAKQGHPVCTKGGGESVRLICFDRRGNKDTDDHSELVGLCSVDGGAEYIRLWRSDGSWLREYPTEQHDNDLMLVEEKKDMYLAVFRLASTGKIDTDISEDKEHLEAMVRDMGAEMINIIKFEM